MPRPSKSDNERMVRKTFTIRQDQIDALHLLSEDDREGSLSHTLRAILDRDPLILEMMRFNEAARKQTL